MTGRERMLAAMAGRPTDQTPMAIDYLMLYLAERMENAYVDAYRPRLKQHGRVRLDPDEDVEIRAQAVADAYACLREPQDWMGSFAGPGRGVVAQRELVLEGDKVFEVELRDGTRRQMLLSGEKTKTEEYRERFERLRSARMVKGEVGRLLRENRALTLAARSDWRLIELIAKRCGKEQIIYTGAGAPFWLMYGQIGFEGMMTALYDAPDMVVELMDALLEFTLQDAQSFRDAGGDIVRIEECLASADMISPRLYERYALPYEEKLCSALRRMGFKVILYFCGDVLPRLPYVRQLPIDALIVEESKKDFVIDMGSVRQAAGPDLCLFGNVDAYDVLLKATPAGLQAEVQRQIDAAGRQGRFVMATGSPVTLDTPSDRVDLFSRLARQSRPTL
jgi:uroporphyrinogen-III decarboxylase